MNVTLPFCAEGASTAAADAGRAPRDADSGTGAIDIRLDDRLLRVPPGTTLAGLVEALGHAPADVASAVNGIFVSRAQRDGCMLSDGDAVMLFKPIVGG